MSGTIRYDSLLVHHLALELERELRGQRLPAVHFAREQGLVALQTEDRALILQSTTGVLRWSEANTADQALPLPRRPSVSAVRALPDERVLRIELTGGARANATFVIVVELLSGQRNVIALDDAGRVLKQLDPQGRTRQQRGQPYVPPAVRRRSGTNEPIALDAWLDLLATVSPDERSNKLIDQVAYISRINAPALLEVTDLTFAHQRYRELVTAEPKAFVLQLREQSQPYGHSLWQADAIPAETLLAAIDSVARAAAAGLTTTAQLERDVERVQRKLTRLHAESSAATEQASVLRASADLLLANVHAVKRGSREIELTGFDGAPVRLELDPALGSTEQAQAWYEQARKRSRAADRLPGLISEAENELAEMNELLQRARAGERVEVRARPQSPPRTPAEPGERLPYRRYRTSSGLEVRVGKSSRANDELTLKHSSPNDIWLHARHTGGAHVVLRWSDAKAAPPKPDLLQAAALAALHSKARHARTVPVDWTRRKYVRKPRGAAAGSVMVERVKTVFVQVNPEIEERLRWTD